MTATHGGKGSTRRPTDHKKFSENWERIFGKKEYLKPDTEHPCPTVQTGDKIKALGRRVE